MWIWRLRYFFKLVLLFTTLSLAVYFYTILKSSGYTYKFNFAESVRYSKQAKAHKNQSGKAVMLKEQSVTRHDVRQTRLPYTESNDEQCLRFPKLEKADILSDKLFRDSLYKYERQGPSSVFTATSSTKKLYVHVVPFSHVDPGWLKTFGDYINSTDYTLYSMLEFMRDKKNAAMTFTWAEIIFFNEWWSKLKDNEKREVKKLIKNGKFELNTGSWVMTDEASTHYWASIDNIIEGHQFLKEEFGQENIPTVGWSNDPFGYSSTVRYLFKLANVSDFIIHRVSSNVKEALLQSQNSQFKWRQYFDSTGRYDSLIHMLPGVHYDIPNTCGSENTDECCQFDFVRLVKYGCGTQPVAITKRNVANKSEALARNYRNFAAFNKHGQILVTLGDDFRYLDAEEWRLQHDNYKLLFDYINSNDSFHMHVKFSTLTEYFKAIKPFYQSQNSIKTFRGDFFPYFDMPTDVWTGYYTSRPVYKKLDRQVQAMIRTADICSSMLYIQKKQSWSWFLDKIQTLRKARRNLALFQHHDAITGTSRMTVVKDYGKRLYEALNSAASVLGECVETAIFDQKPPNDSDNNNENDYSIKDNVDAKKDNVSVKSSSNAVWVDIDFKSFDVSYPTPVIIKMEPKKRKILSVYNSLPYERSEIVTVLVSASNVHVTKCESSSSTTNQNREKSAGSIVYQINPHFNRNGEILAHSFELLISVNLPPLSVTNFCLELARVDVYGPSVAKIFVDSSFEAIDKIPRPFIVEKLTRHSTLSLTNGYVTTTHNKTTGFLQEIRVGSKIFQVEVSFTFYEGGGGAYLFSPLKTSEYPLLSEPSKVYVVKGRLREEVHFAVKGLYHKETLSKLDSDSGRIALDIENIVDLAAKGDGELAMRINSTLSSQNKFFTDSNAFQIMPRTYVNSSGVEKNYYPIASAIFLEDRKHRLTLLTGQPHGGTSPDAGVLEVMLDRRTAHDDLKGLGEPMQDNLPARSNFRLILEKIEKASTYPSHSMDTFQQSNTLLYRPVVFYHTKDNRTNPRLYSPLNRNFPCDFHLLNVRPLNTAGELALIVHRVHTNCNKRKITSRSCAFNDTGLDEFFQILTTRRAKFHECTLSGIHSVRKKATSDLSDDNEQQSTSSLGSVDDVIKNYKDMKLMDIKSYCFRLTL